MAKDEVGTDLVTIEDTDDMVAALTGDFVPEIEDPEVIAAQIVERILATEKADEVLGGNTAVHAQDILTRPFTLHSLKLMRSRHEGGPGVFAVLDAEFLDSGAREAVTCGGRTVMAQAVQLHRLDALPRDVRIVKAETPTSNGFYPLWMEEAK